ncbi:MAG: Rpn family recombination-promoting nuclease/putative transposase [Eubacterium sp.]|nr:Rpn family recombination-promoting nuclease/putative transposase [Eubacterium sp.]
MEKERQAVINNPHLHDSGGKLIFGDNILCAQFLRDYADLEILRNVVPEDIEDVSERYVLLYSTQRDSDIVKKVNIARYMSAKGDENPLGLPLYVVSLVEHKARVEYNVCMQIFRYMYCIWDDYEKEMEKVHPGISVRKDFRYPPILPVVYYEGTERWTAPLDISERILCKELLGNYLPHFTYQVVRLHDYSNEELLEKGDEISLAMLVNKIRSPEDVERFTDLPQEKVDGILKDTPTYLLDIMAKVARALFYHMEIPEEETEKAVAKIKERKMGMLFEGVTSYREEIEKMRAEHEREMQAEFEREIQAERRRSRREAEISRHIIKMMGHEHSAEEIRLSLSREFGLSEREAEETFRELTE